MITGYFGKENRRPTTVVWQVRPTTGFTSRRNWELGRDRWPTTSSNRTRRSANGRVTSVGEDSALWQKFDPIIITGFSKRLQSNSHSDNGPLRFSYFNTFFRRVRFFEDVPRTRKWWRFLRRDVRGVAWRLRLKRTDCSLFHRVNHTVANYSACFSNKNLCFLYNMFR